MSATLPKVEIAREAQDRTLLCYSRRDVPLVHMTINIPGGNLHNPHHLPGLAAIATDLLCEGPAHMTPMEWHRKTEKLAADISFDAASDHWSFTVGGLSENFSEACELAASVITAPGLPKSEWKHIVKAARAEAKETWAQPAAVIRQIGMVQNLGFGHPFAHPAVEKSYRNATYADGVDAAKRALYSREGIVAMIGGDIEPDQGFEHLRRFLAVLPTGGQEVDMSPAARPSAATTWIADNSTVDQAFFVLGRPGVPAGDKDRVALRLANYLIGGGSFQSRLMDKVREEAGGTYGIHSSLREHRLESPFMINSFTKVERLSEMLGIIDKALREIVDTGFTEDELAIAAGNLYGALPLRLTAPRAILSWVERGISAGLSQEDLEADWEAYRTTSLAAVNAAARRLIGDGQFHRAFIGPAKDLVGQLGASADAKVFPFKTTPDKW